VIIHFHFHFQHSASGHKLMLGDAPPLLSHRNYLYLEKRSMRLYCFLLFFFLGACGDADTGSGSMAGKKSLVEIQLQESIDSLLTASPVKFSEGCMSQVNMCWYRIDKSFGDNNLPSVKVNGALILDDVAGVSIAVDKDVGGNIENLDLSIRSLTDNSRHEEYQAFLYSLLEKIKSAGWRHYYSPTDPRISGSQLDKIASPDEVLGSYVLSHPWLDPDYKISLSTWLKVGKFYEWHFYNDGNYLTLRAWRHDSDDAPDERGTYLVSLNFTTEREYWSVAFSESKDKARWKELLPGLLKNYKAIRDTHEKKAIDAGIEIDNSYQDPPIKALE
jgi:hypothetical protein